MTCFYGACLVAFEMNSEIIISVRMRVMNLKVSANKWTYQLIYNQMSAGITRRLKQRRYVDVRYQLSSANVDTIVTTQGSG